MRVLVRLSALAFKYKRRIALAWLCLLGAGGFTLLMPKLLGWAIDFGIGEEHERRYLILAVAGGAIVGSALMRGLFGYGQQYLGQWLAQRVAYDLRNSIYNRLQRLSFAYHDQQQTGQLMSRATQDVEAVLQFIQMGLLRALYLVVMLAAALVLMGLSNWQLTLVIWPFLVAVTIISLRANALLRPVWTLVQDGLAKLTTVLQESLSGVRVVKAFGQERREIERFTGEAQSLFNYSYKASQIQSVFTPLGTAVWMLAMAVTVYFGGREIAAGRLSQGGLAQFALYLTLLQMPVRSIGWIVNVSARASAAGLRIFEILDAESAVKERHGATALSGAKGHVKFEGVAFGYTRLSPVLTDIEIDAKPGQAIALLGPTGSGKTTIVNLLPRFYDVTAGRITIDGVDIRDTTLSSLRQCIGTVQQDIFLFSGTIRDNITYGVPGATQEQIERVAKAARIHDFIMGLPERYATWVGERGVNLSGGQKQRVAIARTLLLNPPILMLDDSTSSVDMETEYLIQQALHEVMKGRTTFVIAQRLRTVKQADQILVLDKGRIVERGRHEELLKLDGFYRRIYDLELRDQEEALERSPGATGAPAPVLASVDRNEGGAGLPSGKERG